MLRKQNKKPNYEKDNVRPPTTKVKFSPESPGSPGEAPFRFDGLPSMSVLRDRFNKVRKEMNSSSEDSRDEAQVQNLRQKLEEAQTKKRGTVEPGFDNRESLFLQTSQMEPESNDENQIQQQDSMSNYERKMMKKIGADILDPQMVYMPKDRQFSEGKSIEQSNDIDKLNEQPGRSRIRPKPQLKRGASHDQNALDPVLGPSQNDDARSKNQIYQYQPPMSEQRKHQFSSRDNNKLNTSQKKSVGFLNNQGPNEQTIGMQAVTPSMDGCKTAANDQFMLPKAAQKKQGVDIRQHQSDMIVDHLNLQINALIQNGPQIHHYHEDVKKDENESCSTFGTISSADERDMGLLFNGDHTYQFQAVQTVKSIVKEQNQKREQLSQQLILLDSRWQSFQDFVTCKEREQKEKEILDIKNKLIEMENPAMLFTELGLSGNFVRNCERVWRQQKQDMMQKLVSSKKLPIEELNVSKKLNAHSQKLAATGQGPPAGPLPKTEKSWAEKKDTSQSKLDNAKSTRRESLWERAKSNKVEKKNPKQSVRGLQLINEANELNDNDREDDQNQSSIMQNLSQYGEQDEDMEDQEQIKSDHVHDDDCQDIHIKEKKNWRDKFRERYMIDPSNTKLKKFRLLVSFSYYLDFIYTSCLVGNYDFQIGKQQNFMDHSEIFMYIIIIQSIDIILNFFKKTMIDVKIIDDPITVAKNYIMGEFLFDVVAVLPWSDMQPSLTFIRYLKFRKFNMYQQHVDDLVQDLMQNFLNNEQLKKLKSFIRLIIKIISMTHFFANLWILIGLRELHFQESGWILDNIQGELIPESSKNDFSYLYVTSVYWVITSFSSVGYGDITGLTKIEYCFQMLVEMIGIGFFGYMIGTFQQLLQGFRVKDLKAEKQDEIDLWLIQLDKARKSVILSKSIFKEVRYFYAQHFKYDAVQVSSSVFFDQLKPRLKKNVLDSVFKNFYQTFHSIFEGCGLEFQRSIFNSAKFNYLGQKVQQEEDNCDWLKDEEPPIIEHSGKKPKCVHFILQGTAHIMNREGMYEYGVLQEGSYFGDISILLDQPSEYSYFYNPNNEKALMMLSLSAREFLKICDQYPLAKDILVERAHKRREMFENYKSIILLKYMKAIRKKPSIDGGQQPASKTPGSAACCNHLAKEKNVDLQIQILDAFIKQYDYNRQFQKLQSSENELNYKDGIGRNKTQKDTELQTELLEARQQAIAIDKEIEQRKSLKLKQMSEMIQSEGAQGITLAKQLESTQIKNQLSFADTPKIKEEGPQQISPQIEENKPSPGGCVREGSEGGQKEDRWDEGDVERINSVNLNADEERMIDRPLSIPDSIHERGNDVKSPQPTDTPRYESNNDDNEEEHRAIQFNHESRIGLSRGDLNAEGGSISDGSFEQARRVILVNRSKSLGYIEGGSSESSNAKSANKQQEIQKRPTIVFQRLNTFREEQSMINRSLTNKSLKPPLNPRRSSPGLANRQSSSGSGSGNQKSGGSKQSSNPSLSSKNQRDHQEATSPIHYNESGENKLQIAEQDEEGVKIQESPYQINEQVQPTRTQNFSQTQTAQARRYFDSEDRQIHENQEGNEPRQPKTTQIETEINRETEMADDYAVKLNPKPYRNVLNGHNQSFGNDAAASILLNTQERDKVEEFIVESPKKVVIADDSDLDLGADPAAQQMLNDIIDSNYKSASLDQLADLIERNKAAIRKLLKQYFALIQRNEQRRRQQKQIYEQNMRMFAHRFPKRTQHKSYEQVADDPISHIDMIIEEYINLKQINQELGRTMAQQMLGEGRKNYASNNEAAIASTLLFAKKMGDEPTTQGQPAQKPVDCESQQGSVNENPNNIKRMQNKEFKKLNFTLANSITDQLKVFTDRFSTQLTATEDKINKLVSKKLDFIKENFDSLSDEDKEFFLLKIQEKAIRDRQKLTSVKERPIWDLVDKQQRD